MKSKQLSSLTVQPEPGEERDRKNDHPGGVIRRNGDKVAEMHDALLIQHEIVKNEIKQQVEPHVRPAANRVTERL